MGAYLEAAVIALVIFVPILGLLLVISELPKWLAGRGVPREHRRLLALGAQALLGLAALLALAYLVLV